MIHDDLQYKWGHRAPYVDGRNEAAKGTIPDFERYRREDRWEVTERERNGYGGDRRIQKTKVIWK